MKRIEVVCDIAEKALRAIGERTDYDDVLMLESLGIDADDPDKPGETVARLYREIDELRKEA